MYDTIEPFTEYGIKRITIIREKLDTLWINTGSRCPYKCPQCHLQSSPNNKSLLFMIVEDITPYLDEYATIPCSDGIRTIGFTGGEPFINPHFLDMLHAVLFHDADFHVLILTTATQTLTKKWQDLEPLLNLHGKRITIRVSIDHPTEKKHVQNRHNDDHEKEPAIWEPMIEGLSLLAHTPCTLGITGLSWEGESIQDLKSKYEKLCKSLRIKIPTEEIVIFPSRVTNYDQHGDADFIHNGITQGCLDTFKKKKGELMCSNAMMLVKPRKTGRIGIAPCTIIPYNESYCVSACTIAEIIQTPMPLAHTNCLWCLSGGNCSGSCDT